MVVSRLLCRLVCVARFRFDRGLLHIGGVDRGDVGWGRVCVRACVVATMAVPDRLEVGAIGCGVQC